MMCHMIHGLVKSRKYIQHHAQGHSMLWTTGLCLCRSVILNSTPFTLKCPSWDNKLHGLPNNTALRKGCLQEPHTPNQWMIRTLSSGTICPSLPILSYPPIKTVDHISKVFYNFLTRLP